jgi:hypothetical protein
MKYTILAAVMAITVGTTTTAEVENQRSACGMAQPTESLSALLTQWNQAGFNTPTKPAQDRVDGQNGYVTSGPGYDSMVSHIRAATNDARLGRDCAEATNVADASEQLASAKGTTASG